MKYSNTMRAFTLPVLILGLALAQSCGRSSGSGTSSQSNASAREQIQIPLSVTESDQTSLALFNSELGLLAAPGGVSATSFAIQLTGCSSGETGTNAVQGTINVYLFDTNCLGKLSSFVLAGNTYLPSGTGSVPFTTWLAGNTAVFVSGANLINVQVVSQLSSPIQSTDVISYNFTIISAGTNAATITVSQAIPLFNAGTYAPNFKINSGGAVLTNIVSSGVTQGAGQFTFQLICSTGAMTAGQGADSSFSSFCPNLTAGGLFAGGATGVDIGSTYLSYKLITDVSGVGTLTLALAQAAFASGDSVTSLPSSIISGNTGFNSGTMTGPVTISSNSKMLLVLQAKNTNPALATNPLYSSFEYFAITLPTVTP